MRQSVIWARLRCRLGSGLTPGRVSCYRPTTMIWLTIVPAVMFVITFSILCWLCSLLIAEARKSLPNRTDANHVLTHSEVGPGEPFRSMIALWLFITEC